MNSEKPKSLQEFEQSMASLDESVKELKACMSGAGDDKYQQKVSSLADAMYSSINNLRQTVWDLHDSNAKRLNDHVSNGHMPAFKSNKHLQNFLKACDMESDYTISPKDLTASYAYSIRASKNGVKVEIDLTKPKQK